MHRTTFFLLVLFVYALAEAFSVVRHWLVARRLIPASALHQAAIFCAGVAVAFITISVACGAAFFR